MPIAIYARKSTESEDRQVQSLEDQIRELTALAKREGLVVFEVYQEARSAKEPNNRPEFARLIRAVECGEVTGILTWKINRLSRNELDGGCVGYLLRKGKLQFIRTIERTYRPDDNALLFAIENGMGISELQDLSRNVARGMRGKVERGWHSSKAPIGYKNDRDTRKILPDEERFHLVRKAWDLMLSGQYSVIAVHRQLVRLGLCVRSQRRHCRPISHPRLHKLLRDRFYVGQIPYKGKLYPGKHVPMVTEEEFLAVQDILDRSNRERQPSGKPFAFGGAIHCAVCGCMIVGETRRKHYPRTRRTVHYTYYHCSGSKGCSKKGVRQEALHSQVEATVLKLHLKRGAANWLRQALVEAVERGTAETAEDVTAMQRKELKETDRLQTLTAMRLDGEISADEYSTLREAITDRLVILKAEANEARDRATKLLRLIYKRLDIAVHAGELQGGDADPFALGMVLRAAGNNVLNLKNGLFELDPLLSKIATFEPVKSGSDKLERGDFLPMNSVWWTLVDDLLSTATDQMEREACRRATMDSFQLREGRRRERL